MVLMKSDWKMNPPVQLSMTSTFKAGVSFINTLGSQLLFNNRRFLSLTEKKAPLNNHSQSFGDLERMIKGSQC